MNALLNTLEARYESLRPEAGVAAFSNRVFNRLLAQFDMAPERLMGPDERLLGQALNEFVQEVEEPPAEIEIWTIYGACAYCVAAGISYRNHDEDRAWDLIAEANFHLGWILATGADPVIYADETLKHVKSLLGASLAAGTHRETNEMAAAAQEFVRKSNGFKTLVAAREAIDEMLQENFPDRLIKDPKTIDRWVRQMPDCSRYIESIKKRENKKNQ